MLFYLDVCSECAFHFSFINTLNNDALMILITKNSEPTAKTKCSIYQEGEQKPK
jgi:hypothetical protein